MATEPILRRLSEAELAIVEAADHFNASQFRRTVGGIAKSLGTPRVSITPLSGVNKEIVITVAWEISWYQYRVTPESNQPVRLEGRGHELDEVDGVVHRLERPHGRGRPRRPRRRRRLTPPPGAATYTTAVIYCVIPPEWVDDLYDKMVAYYAGNPDVTVIVDRRKGDRRARGGAADAYANKRELHDRRRARMVGTFPTTEV